MGSNNIIILSYIWPSDISIIMVIVAITCHVRGKHMLVSTDDVRQRGNDAGRGGLGHYGRLEWGRVGDNIVYTM